MNVSAFLKQTTSKCVTSPRALTPVEEVGPGLLLKRDDLYQPFSDVAISGSKVRQCQLLLQAQREYIRAQCGSHVYSATSPHSPQGLIVARVAKQLGFTCTLVFGGAHQTTLAQKYRMVRKALEFGNTTTDCACNLGFDGPMYNRIRELQETQPGFVVKFGMNLQQSPKAVIGAVAQQARNIPDDVDVLVIPVGSGVTMGCILSGIARYKKSSRYRVIGIQITGYDRSEIISGICDNVKYELWLDSTYSYSREVERTVADRVQLDPIYESKAYDCLLRHKRALRSKKLLFWVIGNSLHVR